MILFDGSGGSTKGIGVYHVWKTAYDMGYTPDIISGVSISSILSVPFALGKFKELEYLLDNFDMSYIYSKPPVNNKGKFTLNSVLNILTGKKGISKMDNLEIYLRMLITEEDFKKYKYNNKYPICVGMMVNYKDGSRTFFNCKKLSYEKYIMYTLASANVPIYNEPIVDYKDYYFDGGVRNHSIAYEVLDMYPITRCISVFTRPEKYEGNLEWKPKNILSVLERTIEIQNVEISKNSEYWLKERCKDKNIKLNIVFLPKVLSSLYDTNRERLEFLKNESIKLTKSLL